MASATTFISLDPVGADSSHLTPSQAYHTPAVRCSIEPKINSQLPVIVLDPVGSGRQQPQKPQPRMRTHSLQRARARACARAHARADARHQCTLTAQRTQNRNRGAGGRAQLPFASWLGSADCSSAWRAHMREGVNGPDGETVNFSFKQKRMAHSMSGRRTSQERGHKRTRLGRRAAQMRCSSPS